MTASEQAAFRAGIAHAAEMAVIAAVTMEARPDAADMRQRAAIEALRGLSEGLKAQAVEPKGTHETRSPVSAQPCAKTHGEDRQ